MAEKEEKIEVEGDRLIGTLTDRDIVVRVVAEGKDPEEVAVREVASTDVVTVDPQQDLAVELDLLLLTADDAPFGVGEEKGALEARPFS